MPGAIDSQSDKKVRPRNRRHILFNQHM
jgi:hypothetical protein